MKQVVVVEDNHAIRRALESWLLDAGYDVVSSVRFEDARAYLAQHTPDILLTDVRLGEYNGLQLVLLLKGQHPHVQAIVFCDYDDPVLALEAERCGAHFVRRPLTSDGLMDCLRQSA